jgi:Xaa-Pro dipeptidase
LKGEQGTEMDMRIGKLVAWLESEGIDAAFLSSPTNVYYFTGFKCDPHERLLGLFLFAEGDPLLICPQLELSSVRQAGWHHIVISYHDAENPWELLRDFVEQNLKRSKRTIAIEKEHLSYARAEQLQNIASPVEFVAVDEQINELRMVKDEQEIAIMMEAAKLADDGIEIAISHLQEGITELEVASKIEWGLKQKGVQEFPFPTTVLFGERSALPHGTPGLRRLRKGDLVLIDLGVKWKGYCSDITRTFAFDHLDEPFQEIYLTVLKAQEAAIAATKPGIQAGALDRIARSVIEKAGYGDYFIHRLGHGLGIDVHESPSLHAANHSIIRVGMTFTIEPGIYLPGQGGIRIEDDIFVTADGYRLLTRYPKELRII